LLRDKAEELHGLIYKIGDTILDQNHVGLKSVKDISNELELSRATLIIDFYFPELREAFNMFISKCLDHYTVEEEDIVKLKMQIASSNGEFIKILVKRFKDDKLDQ
jgi:hypothetical protein